MKIIIALTFIVFTTLTSAQQQVRITRTTEKGKPFTDQRDGETYKTVKYKVIYPDKTGDSVIWMARNLNYKMAGAYSYKDKEENSQIYGRLYTWHAAKEACPKGWHLPSDEEWYHLAFHFGGNCECGESLKSDSELWKNETSRGNNKSLFNVIPSGLGSRQGTYYRLGWVAIFWSSSERDAQGAWDWKLRGGNELQRWHGSKNARNSVRCVKD